MIPCFVVNIFRNIFVDIFREMDIFEARTELRITRALSSSSFSKIRLQFNKPSAGGQGAGTDIEDHDASKPVGQRRLTKAATRLGLADWQYKAGSGYRGLAVGAVPT